MLHSCSVMSDSLRPHRLQPTRLPCPSLYSELLKLMSIKSVMPSSHLILCHPLLLLLSISLSIGVFSNDLDLYIRWPKDWSLSLSISPSSEYSGLIFFGIDRFDLLADQGTVKSLLQHHSSKYQFFGAQPTLWSNSHSHTWQLEKPSILPQFKISLKLQE